MTRRGVDATLLRQSRASGTGTIVARSIVVLSDVIAAVLEHLQAQLRRSSAGSDDMDGSAEIARLGSVTSVQGRDDAMQQR